MKVSEVTFDDVVNYLHMDIATDEEKALIENSFMPAAREYIKSYTGLSADEVDEFEDITSAYLLLISDFFDNRNLQMDYKSVARNKAVDIILGMHSVNLL